ncbi:hydroxysteroid 17-beta dehydrogenase 12 spidey [Arctopsyche grandis]|uniref:hydroxysteroid 17-beta dehydrogenase 12 spidey n=1 Tax=Arctopsyche grandis TaxID=121162 RepID=UPI00406D9E39
MSFSSLEKVGLVSVLIVAYVSIKKLVVFIYNNFLGPTARKIDFKSMGQWALITGSTDGVGKAYARALANKGCDIILVSRTESKLSEVAAEIERDFHVKTMCIVADFTESENIYDHIEKQLLGLEIGVLVNNVGVSYPYPEYFLDLPEKDLLCDRIIKANVVAVTKMCSMIMPGMVERKKGVVINISSLLATMPSPMYTIYAATKLYVDKFTQDLASSYGSKGIVVQSVKPGAVATKMSKIHRATWMAPSPDVYVSSALSTCGKSVSTTGYGPHDLLWGFIATLEFVSPTAALWLVNKTTENIRNRALKKMSSSKS